MHYCCPGKTAHWLSISTKLLIPNIANKSGKNSRRFDLLVAQLKLKWKLNQTMAKRRFDSLYSVTFPPTGNEEVAHTRNSAFPRIRKTSLQVVQDGPM